MANDIWADIGDVYLKSLWGWSPATWGCVGFTHAGRRGTIVRETSDPFIMVGYVTKRAGSLEGIDGLVTGFYVVSHIEGDRDEFTAVGYHANDRNRWRYSLKAVRAFDFLPEYRLDIADVYPEIGPQAVTVAAHGVRLLGAPLSVVKAIPYVEVPVFGGPDSGIGDMVVPDGARGMVKSGPVNWSGYTVSGEPRDTEKELYVLLLRGDAQTFLGKPVGARCIYKIGLSMSPTVRLDALRKSLPEGAFGWELHRTTRLDKHSPYPSFEAAEAGETAMKRSLAASADWLGGEFYAATDAELDAAWKAGREAALAFSEPGRQAHDG